MNSYIILYLLILAGVVAVTWEWFTFRRLIRVGGAVVWLGFQRARVGPNCGSRRH